MSNTIKAAEQMKQAYEADISKDRRITKMVIKRESEKAYLLAQPGSSFTAWLPKSKMSDISIRNAKLATGQIVQIIDFTIPGWLADEKCM